MYAFQKQHFGFVNVANAADDGLIHHRFADRCAVLSPKAGHDCRRIDRRAQQIRAQPLKVVIAQQLARGDQFDQLRIEAHHTPAIGLQDHRCLTQGSLPVVVKPVDMPRSGHAHVSMQDAVIIKMNHQVFATSFDAGHRASRQRVCVGNFVTTACIANDLAVKHLSQVHGGAVNCVAFGHGLGCAVARNKDAGGKRFLALTAKPASALCAGTLSLCL